MGTLVYTSMLNPRGGIECDFTVTRVAEDLFRVVTGTGFGTHDLAWIRSNAPLGFAVKLEKGDFIGRDALVAQSSQPLSTKLACLLLKISARWLWGRSRCSTREANG